MKTDEILARLVELRDGLQNGSVPKNEKARVRNEFLGLIVKFRRIEWDYQQLRGSGRIGALDFFPDDDGVMTPDDRDGLIEALLVYEEICRMLPEPAAQA
jgi:hypothetical protein